MITGKKTLWRIECLLAIFVFMFGITYTTGELNRASAQDDRILHNLGVHFRHLDRVRVINEQWSHTFVMKMPTREFEIEETKIKCEEITRKGATARPNTTGNANTTNFEDINRCGENTEFVDLIKEINEKMGKQFYMRIVETYDLFPNHRIKANREARSPLDIIGEGASWLFGIATVKQTLAAERKVNELIKKSATAGGELEKQIEDLMSVNILTNKRLEHAKEREEVLRKNINALTIGTKSNIGALANLTVILGKKLAHMEMYREAVIEHLAALQNLAKGKLEPSLISVRQMNMVKEDITRYLKDNYPGFGLVTDNNIYYYNDANVISYRMNETLYITIQIPITTLKSEFEVYKMEYHGVPMPGNGSHTTKITDGPKYVAIGRAGYVHYQFEEEPKIEKGIMNVGNEVLRMGTEDCIMSLYRKDMKGATKHCKMVIIKDGLESKMMRLTVTTILLINIREFKMTCPKQGRTIHEGCRHCIIKIQCGCQIANERFLITPKFEGCANTTENVTKLYPYNLRILTEFFEEYEIRDLQASTLLEEELEVIIPAFKFEEGKEKEHVQSDEKIQIDINGLIKKIKEESKVYESHASALAGRIEDMQTETEEPDKWKGILLIVSSTVSGVCLVGIIILFARVTQLSAVILVSTAVQAYEQGTIKRRLKYQGTGEKGAETVEEEREVDAEKETEWWTKWIEMNISVTEHITIVQLIIIIAIAISVWVTINRLRQRMKPKYIQYTSVIWINVSRKGTVIPIRGQVIGDISSKYTIKGRQGIRNITVKAAWKPKLQIEWGIEMYHKMKGEQVLDKEIEITWTEYRRLKTLIKTEEWMAIVYIQSGSNRFEELDGDEDENIAENLRRHGDRNVD